MAAAVALGVVEHALVQLRENLPADDKAAAAEVEQMLQSSQRLRGLLRLGDGPASVSADPNAEDEAKQRLRRSSRVLDSGPKALAVLHEGHIQEIMRGFDLNENGKIELSELLAVSNDIGIPEHELEQMFHAADEDGDCKVDPKEFVELWRKMTSSEHFVGDTDLAWARRPSKRSSALGREQNSFQMAARWFEEVRTFEQGDEMYSLVGDDRGVFFPFHQGGTTTTPQVRPERRVQFDSTLEYTECCLSTAE